MPDILIFCALCVYPPIVVAIFANTGRRDIHPAQVVTNTRICIEQRKTHIFLLCAILEVKKVKNVFLIRLNLDKTRVGVYNLNVIYG